MNNTKIIKIPRELNNITIINVIKNLEDFFTNNDENKAELNFEKTKFVFPSGLTPLISYLRDRYQKNDKKTIVINSKKSMVDSYLRRMKFFSLLGMNDNYFFKTWSGKEKFVEPYYFSKMTDPNKVNEKSEDIIKTFTVDRHSMYYNEAIGWCISEIIDNAQNHSNSDINVAMAQKYPSGVTEFCVSDRGIGIRESMGLNNTKLALERCITKDKGIHSQGMGNGLYYTTELIKRDTSGKCSMSIWTENYILLLYSNSIPVIKETNAYWQGVNIKISMYNGISESLSKLMKQIDNVTYSYSYDEQPEYYENLFEN